ncbi:zinc finger protein 845-like [Mytilus californianus]|uniref:zinc finger protein 845-like n=1 Tax=Mytilus californianus TaxID=6549 RepID=UPI002246CA0B|nr:zinc finger protein 845-like [Mytilus californianus]
MDQDVSKTDDEEMWKDVEKLGKRFQSKGKQCIFLAVGENGDDVQSWCTEAGVQFITQYPKWTSMFQDFCSYYQTSACTKKGDKPILDQLQLISNRGNERTKNDKMPNTENTVGSVITSHDQTEDQLLTLKSKQESTNSDNANGSMDVFVGQDSDNLVTIGDGQERTDTENVNKSIVAFVGKETDHLVTTLNGQERTDTMSDTNEMECGNDVEDDDTDDYTVNDDFDTDTNVINPSSQSSATGKISEKVTETKKSADILKFRNSPRLRQSSKTGHKKTSNNKNNPIVHNIRTRGSTKVNLSEIKDCPKRSRGQIEDKIPKSLTSCVVKLENLSDGTLKNGEGVDKICENLSVSKRRKRSKDGIEKSLNDAENELQVNNSFSIRARKTAVNKKDQIKTLTNEFTDMCSTRARKSAVNKQEQMNIIPNEDLNEYLNRKEYICGVCSNESSNSFSYYNHVKNHRNYQLCKVCDVMIPSGYETMEKHRKEVHSDDLFFKCPKCNKKFKSKLQLKTHFPSHDSDVKSLDRDASLSDNSKVMVMSKEQERLSKMHPDLQEITKYLNRTEYTCSLCSHEYNNSVSYYNHIRSHKDHQLCKVCDMMIPYGAERMEKHRKEIHGDDFFFKCPDCDRKYKSKLGLKTHFIVHHADQSARFTCRICKAVYGNASMLKRHEKIHTFEHSCFICQEKIETNLKLKEHMLEAHSFHFCVTCSLYFVDSLELEEHEQTHFNSNSSDDDDPATNSTSFEESSSSMPLLEKENVSSEMEPVETASNHSNIQAVDVDKEKMSAEAADTDTVASLIIDLTPECSEVTMVTSDMPDISVDENNTAYDGVGQIQQKFNNFDKKCKFCGKRFKHGNALVRHVKLHNNKANFTCVHCGQVCKTDETYKRHLLVHLPNEEKPQHCEKCGKGFATYSALKIHSYTHFDKNHFMCEFCGKGYRDPKMLKIHRRTHTGEYPYHCTMCDKKFRSWDLLDMHKITHKSQPDVMCDVCGKTFSHRIRLAAHRKRHTDEKKHKCTLCVKLFKSQYNLQQHCISMHIEYAKSRGWKMHECKDCGRLLATKERFRRHVRIHTGERPFGCEICAKRFAENGNLKAHMKIHNDDKQFQCTYCSKKFIHNRTLRKHLLIHEKPVQEDTFVNRSRYTPDELLAISIVADSNNYVLQNNPSIPGQQTVTETRSYNLELNKKLEQKTHAAVQSEDKLVIQHAQQVDIPVEAIQTNDSGLRDKIRLMYN